MFDHFDQVPAASLAAPRRLSKKATLAPSGFPLADTKIEGLCIDPLGLTLEEKLDRMMENQGKMHATLLEAIQELGEELKRPDTKSPFSSSPPHQEKALGQATNSALLSGGSAPSVPSSPTASTLNPALAILHRIPSQNGQQSTPFQMKGVSEEHSFRRSMTNQETPMYGSTEGHEGLASDWPRSVSNRFVEAYGARTQGASLDPVRSVRKLSEFSQSEEEERKRGYNSMCRDPTSRQVMWFKMIGAVCMFFEAVTVPFMLAWDFAYVGLMFRLSCTTALYWTADIAVSFCVGYFHDGRLVTDQKKITQRYLRSWFLPDVCLVVFDWWSILASFTTGEVSVNSSTKLMRLVKLGKILRIFAMIRAARTIRMFREILDQCTSDREKLLARFLTVIMTTIWTAHFLACLWYAVGSYSESNTGRRWVNFFETEGIEDSPMAQYIVSFQWSMSQLTLGTMDVESTNSAERAFNIFCILVGFVGSSMIISILSAELVEYQMAEEERTKMMSRLRRYLRENNVSNQLSTRVQEQVIKRVGRARPLRNSDVDALRVLSTAMRCELQFAVAGKVVVTHALFRYVYASDPVWCERFLTETLEMLYLQPSDDFFLPGQTAMRAYILHNGQVNYVQEPMTSPVEAMTETTVPEQHWLAEATLWADWAHVGRATAETQCALLTVNADLFLQACGVHQQLLATMHGYAVQFVNRLTASCPPHAPWPTDLEIPFTDWSDIVLSMPRALQHSISRDALHHLNLQSGALFQSKDAGKLEQEVDQDRCILVVNNNLQVTRITALVVLQLTRPSDMRTFMKLGSLSAGSLSAACQKPGGKRNRGELSTQALSRLLKGKLSFLDRVTVSSVESQVEQNNSARFGGIPSKYLRTVYTAKYTGEVDLPRATTQVPFSPSVESLKSFSSLESAHFQIQPWMKEQYVYYATSKGGGGDYYTWLLPSEMEQLDTTAGKKALETWLKLLGDPPQEQTESDVDPGSALANVEATNSQPSVGIDFEDFSVGRTRAI